MLSSIGSARRLLGVTTALLLAGGASTSSAAGPEGPRLAYGQWGPGVFSVSLLSVDPFAAQPSLLYRGHRRARPIPLPFDGPSWFPDGSALAFSGLTGSLSGNGPGGSRIFVVGAEGGAPWPVAGTEGAVAPVVSPDGRTLAFALVRERNRITRRPGEVVERVERAASTWIVDLIGGAPRRLTPWRYGVEQVPTSFTPDGTGLAVTRTVNRQKTEVLVVRVDGTGSSVLLRNAGYGIFSPNGNDIAYLQVGRRYRERTRDGFAIGSIVDLFVKSLDGARTIRLTRTPKKSESSPAWDPSGQRLAFVQDGTVRDFFRALGAGNAISQINADGTCRTKLLSWPDAALFGLAWQPGPGREAGRIVC